jgi:putative aminopeptidase FrvX
MDFSPLRELIEIDSPTGYTTRACRYVYETLESYGWKPELTNKGAVKCALGKAPWLGLTAHVDTLGLMVAGIKYDGTLSITSLGSPSFSSSEGEYVRVITQAGATYTGTLLLNNPSSHANNQRETQQRTTETMHIRLDEEVDSQLGAMALEVRAGDIVCFEPRYREAGGFLKGRFMDNKAGCFVLFEVAKRLAAAAREVPVELFFSNYEEVGHGGAGGYAETVRDLLVIDMGVVGQGLSGHEQACSICAKDSSGPYDFEFRQTLIALAQRHRIPFAVDVYPFYSSDGSAALRAGLDLRVALIGPGVAASHGVERTHRRGVEATIDLCMAYIDHACGQR